MLRELLSKICAGAALSLLFWASAVSAQHSSEALPRPPELEPAIQFWKRVYTEVDTDNGFLHDSNNLAIVYQVVDYDRPEIERQRDQVKSDLRVLASGKRQGLSNSQQRILDLWPAGTTNEQFRSAANNVRFQLGQRDRFVAGLIRSGAYRGHIEEVVRAKNLPIELSALPHVESSFHPGAYSSVAAAGMWQFMRATGQRFMRIDHIVDERMDPYTATYAAMSLLEYNYQVLGTWPLALTAYNHGAGGIARAVRETGSNKIEDIILNYKGRRFGFASRNFYPQFLAVLDVERQAQTLFGALQLDPSPEYVEFEMDAFVEAETLARALGVTVDHLQFDNPALRPVVWEGGKRIPKGFVVKVQKDSLTDSIDNLMAQIPSSEKYRIQTPDVAYVVQRGDSLSAIATRFKTSVAQLASLNQLRDRHRIQIGQRLLLPQDTETTTGMTSAEIAANGPASTATPITINTDGTYTVRNGDSIYLIARRLGVEESQLLAANQIDRPDRIFPGQQLRVPSEKLKPSEPSAEIEQAIAEVVDEVTEQAMPESAEVAEAIVSEEEAPEDEPLFIEESEQEILENPIELAESAEAVDPAQNVEQSNEQAVVDLEADPADYSVAQDSTIEIQAMETLGHYAEWLGIRASDLRRLNGKSYGQAVLIGDRLKLDFSQVSVAEFELKRREYHVGVQQEFFRNYRILSVDEYKVAANDNIAAMARRQYSVPMWLLRQYNPELDFSRIQIGQIIVFPVLEAVENEQGSS
ncbi:MAG: LysM peptidoglycan-binding domain-containing protein [Pseudohongiellaceae bacterium]|nr:LysM peptidoglycan-binding domain-containing protein [Pseudohongiellaceae bacterium]